MRESHPSMCTHHMLLRSTQGGCRYVTTHRSSSVRVQMNIEHRAGRRNQLTFSGTALLCTHRAKVQTLSILDSLLARNWKSSSCIYEDCCLLLYLDMSTYEYWCCWCYTFRVVLYDPWPLRAPSPVTHAVAVELNRRTVRLLVSVCLLLFAPMVTFFSRVSLFLPFHSFFAVPSDVPTTSMHSTQQHLRGLRCCCCTYEHLRGLLLLYL